MALTTADTYSDLAYTYGEDLLNVLPAWMLSYPALAQAFLEETIEAGGTSNREAAVTALETVRMAPEYRTMYDEVFAGNRRDDGTLRLNEGAYFARKQGYRDAISAVSNVDPTIFEEDFASLISGDVDVNEFTRRVDSLSARVTMNSPAIRDYYGQNFAIDMTDEGILASMMSPRIGDAVLSKRITMAEIGGEASMRNFDLTREFVEMLTTEGQMDRDEAQQLFGTAAGILPALQALARRHGDTDDTFDITEFAQGASDIADPKQLSRIERLQSTEQSQFTGGAEIEYKRNRATGGVSGLAQS